MRSSQSPNPQPLIYNHRVRLNAIKIRKNLPVIVTALIFALAFLMTVLPYTIYKPYFPFTGDFQHPQNVASILNHGAPYPVTPEYIKEQYPDTFGYLGAVIAALAELDAPTALVFVSLGSMLAGLAAIYFVARQLYGNRAAIFALFAYGLLSYQPRQTLYDGTFIELVSGLVLAPLFLLALAKTLTTRGWRWPVMAGVMAAALVRYHFIGSVQAGVTGALFLAGILIFRRDLITKKGLMALGLMLAVAVALSFPYSFYYIRVGLRIVLGRLGLMAVAAEQEAAFPALAFPGDFYTKLGVVLYHVGLMALGGFVLQRVAARKLRVADILVMAWLAVMIIGSVTSVFIVPERFLRNMALPLALIVGAFLGAIPNQRWLMAAALSVILIPSMIFLGRRVSDHSANLMAALPVDLPSLNALGQIRAAEPDRLVLSDESGPWAAYFADRNSFYIHGGPESFTWTGEPIRTDSLKLWTAYRTPCDENSQFVFEQYNIGYVYLGRKPSHWSPPGYEFQDGARYLACPRFELKYSEVITQPVSYQSTEVFTDHAYIFRLMKPAELETQKPAWVPAEGLTLENALDITPPAPTDDTSNAVYYRRWYELSKLALGETLGYRSDTPADFIAPPAKRPLARLWADVADAKQAKAIAMRGDSRYPEYDFKLWQAFGKPAVWPPASLPDSALSGVVLPTPPGDAAYAITKDWYVANAITYETVYVGNGNIDREKLKIWAQGHPDGALAEEINQMRKAFAAGVFGDPDNERAAFRVWLQQNPQLLKPLADEE